MVAPARIAGSCADWTRAIARIVATAALAGDENKRRGGSFALKTKKRLSSFSTARAHASAVSMHPSSGSTRSTVEGESFSFSFSFSSSSSSTSDELTRSCTRNTRRNPGASALVAGSFTSFVRGGNAGIAAAAISRACLQVESSAMSTYAAPRRASRAFANSRTAAREGAARACFDEPWRRGGERAFSRFFFDASLGRVSASRRSASRSATGSTRSRSSAFDDGYSTYTGTSRGTTGRESEGEGEETRAADESSSEPSSSSSSSANIRVNSRGGSRFVTTAHRRKHSGKIQPVASARLRSFGCVRTISAPRVCAGSAGKCAQGHATEGRPHVSHRARRARVSSSASCASGRSAVVSTHSCVHMDSSSS